MHDVSLYFPDSRIGSERQPPGRRDSGVPFRENLALPDSPRLQHLPLRDRDRALHEEAREQGRVARALNDPSRFLHHEAEQHDRDDALQSSKGIILMQRPTIFGFFGTPPTFVRI